MHFVKSSSERMSFFDCSAFLFFQNKTIRHFSFPKRKVAKKKKAAQLHTKTNFQLSRKKMPVAPRRTSIF